MNKKPGNFASFFFFWGGGGDCAITTTTETSTAYKCCLFYTGNFVFKTPACFAIRDHLLFEQQWAQKRASFLYRALLSAKISKGVKITEYPLHQSMHHNSSRGHYRSFKSQHQCQKPRSGLLGSFSNHDGDGNENFEKAIGLGPVYMEVGDPR